MPPLASTIFNIDTWKNDPPDLVELKCFMPNGITILLTMPSTTTIREIKTETIKKSKMYPLNHLIKDACDYVVSGIIQFGNIEFFTDETKRLCEVQPYFCLLMLGERKEKKNEKEESDYELLKLVTNTIGKSVTEYKAQTTQPEVVDFRRKGMQICDQIEWERSQYSWLQKLFYEHPIRLANSPIMPETIRNRLHSPNFLIVIILENDGTTFTLSVSENDTPRSLMESVLQKMNRSQIKMTDRLSDYILKVRGCDEFIYGDHPLIQFIYIQESVSGNEVPYLVLKAIQSLQCYINHKTEQSLSIKPVPKRDPSKFTIPRTSLWRMKELFSLRLQSIENVNCDLARAHKVGVYLGLYHGEQKLCAQLSVDAPNKSSRNFNFDTRLEFDIKMLNLPRMTRLCIVIYEVTKMSRSKKSSNTSKDNIYKDPNVYTNINPLAWVNTTLFDYKNQLRSGQLSLYSWTYADDIQSEENFHPLGTIEPNPRKEECAVVHLTFLTNDADNIFYPNEEAVLHYAAKLCRDEIFIRDKSIDQTPLIEVLNNCMGIDKIGEIYDQDRSAIWQYRYDIRQHYPEKLSAVLHCVNWNEREKVAEMWNLLSEWPTISIERSLELLDYAFPDPAVRKFAIQCLRLLKWVCFFIDLVAMGWVHEEYQTIDMNEIQCFHCLIQFGIHRDEELLLYLLQLVQAIKHESYLDCDLVIFLLERSLRNQRIGHYFFWHLRSETQTLSMQTRFSLLLEVYLKGSKQHVLPLQKQLLVLEKLKQCSTDAKKGGKDKVKNLLQDFLKKKENICVFQNIQNPLNPSYRWRCVRPEQCKVMDSKMRPLWIVFENADSNHNDIYVIFKNGDDLRQDMLTLQMLRVMDQLWKNEGMDFRMNIYNCISMERRLGMIEVVRHAETIANIQKEKGMFSATSPFKKGSIFTWLKEHNKNDDSLNKAIKEFTLSCAGYCVATYVLGVADRHSDNIMVKRNGQLFHIDFGHILGHFKEKFGVKRERVPFVLTHDFVYVINKGCTDREAEEFRYFQCMCERAFLVLRKHGCLILSLFSMMISTGLPELSSEKDLNYLKETLVLDYTEDKALEHFRAKFSEALANSWKTSLNWASHNFSKNNKQ